MSIRDAYIEKMKLQLNDLTATMNELQARTERAKNAVNGRCLTEMNHLRKQSQVALERLDRLKTTSEETWKNTVADTENLRDAFKKSFHYFTINLRPAAKVLSHLD